MAPGNRLTHGPRDIVLSLLALLIIIGAPLVLTRACTFSPGAPQADPASAPKVDVADSLGRAQAPFRVRVPSVPSAWQGNSVSSGRVDPSGRVVRAGWLTPDRFIQLSQSDAELTDLVAAETGTQGLATGVEDVDGTQWTVFPGRRDEQAWVADVGGVRLLITGSATAEEFRTLAAAAA
ncbi:hypothetical protein JOD54_002115 [Actinokineospora baliensis]|uniref:DUF4245 domain-containing protein n=1 Tax=Actinokineospora baliensis TaxID=547056 RepID=UPI00195D80B9|nr:DUF4245 domain-containing protein [Actinokineospora baliensis]MBM7771911.1 hypothetical protein [Actinokineospora baliensis]